MLKILRIVVLFLLVLSIGFFYGINRKYISTYMSFISRAKILNKIESFLQMSKGSIPLNGCSNKTELETANTPSSTITLRSPSEVLKNGDGIILVETSDRMQPPSLVLCAIESAARVYKNRPVAFFMKGLNNSNIEETVRRHFSVLSSLKNVYFFPLVFEDVYAGTPLQSWYLKIEPKKERYWKNNSSNGCRIVLIWKYGGVYLDTDMISTRAIPIKDFLAAEHSKSTGNSVLGFSTHHYFTLKCMEDFVENYNGGIWGQQGPSLFTRILKTFCDLPKFNRTEDAMCGNITYVNPQRFYPISYSSWREYYKVWDKMPTFNDSYALHLWNYMNSDAKLTMVPGSNTLVEHLYKEYCPSVYNEIFRNETTMNVTTNENYPL
ncbi:alpha-1,4-N-acetylglucosaminyltransferase-like [Anomaloglossus baeobatrachus]|uniref:alpha-1,4-N-acetylglucosaminyltransferase-like n=1 Tax=Anomaloglossus baeobatrachus TaxID=238106 RepID=UPI003F504AA7